MSEFIYINNENQSNKFWSYSLTGTTVVCKWGRIGNDPDKVTKTFPSIPAANKFIQQKIKEKERKGYKLVTKEKLNDEVSTAKELGVRNKVKTMLFCSKSGNKLTELGGYDPEQYVYVEVLDSWNKNMTRLLLSKTETWTIDSNSSFIKTGKTISANKLNRISDGDTFAVAVRGILKRMSAQVVQILKSVKFAAMGVRNLFDDDDTQSTPSVDVQEALKTIDSSGFDPSVISKFASMGARELDL